MAPDSTSSLADYESATARVPEWFFDHMLWEIRSPLRAWRDQHAEGFSATMRGHIERAGSLTLDHYRRALAQRAALTAAHRGFEKSLDGFVTLAHIGPGQSGQPALGTPWYNDASSAIGAPTVWCG